MSVPKDSLSKDCNSVLEIAAKSSAATFDGCMFGYKDPDGELTLKPTTFVTNILPLFRSLNGVRCTHGFRHKHVTGSATSKRLRSAHAQVYPPELVRALLKALAEYCAQ